MDYNEYDDYGMDSAEGGKEYDEMIDAQVREMVEEPAYGCRGCGSPVARPNASCGCPMA